jgi:copper chaperone NosL
MHFSASPRLSGGFKNFSETSASIKEQKASSMKNIVLWLISFLLLTVAFAAARDAVEDPKTCKLCGMQRTIFAHSRMLIVYGDGTTSGVCSLHCAAEELHHTRDKQIRTLMVADYSTRKLLDARKAAWVVGGRKTGVMTALAKWAFAGPEDARRFVDENGGTMSTFDQAMNAATREVMDQIAEERAVENEILSGR